MGIIGSPTNKLNGSFRYHTLYILVMVIVIVGIPDLSDDMIWDIHGISPSNIPVIS